MQDQKLKHEYVLFAVPVNLLLEAGIFEGDSIAMHTEGNKLIIENYEEEFICDGDCDNCHMSSMDCDGECDTCPCRDNCDESEVDSDG